MIQSFSNKSKKLIALFSVVTLGLLALSANAQTWQLLESGTNKELSGVYFANANTGWAVGNNGIILKTTNGGTTWTALTSGTNKQLNSVYFANANTGWAVGNSGLILKTTNAGATWQTLNSGITQALNGVYFIDVNTGWVVGKSGTIFKTTNGGTTWTKQDKEDRKDKKDGESEEGRKDREDREGGEDRKDKKQLNSVYFIDATTGWVVGNNGTLKKTTDGGTTWTDVASGSTRHLNDIYFTNDQTGWIAGNNGTVLKTTNAGQTWTAQVSGVSRHLTGVRFVDANNGWAVGNSGTIINTTNGGATWTEQDSGVNKHLQRVYFVDANTGWAVGDVGVILKYFVPPTPTLSVSVSADPSFGTNPLTGVDLTASVGGTATGNIVYKFDCTNDGTFEHTSASTSQTTYTAADLCSYDTAGTYTAKVEATRGGLTATGTTTIAVTQRTLTVALSASPDTGTNPFDSNLTASVGGNAIGNIVYKFDCTNDGTFEHTSSPTSETSYANLCAYAEAGNYTAKVVASRQGLTAESTVGLSVIQRTFAVALSASPNAGTVPLTGVDLTASVSGNATGNIVYKFDCTNDGTFEHTSSPTSQTTYTAVSLCSYTDAGAHTVGVTAERQGLTATNTVAITVAPQPTLTASLSASPNTGIAPLNNVSFTATVGGTATGNIVYKFDCANDGTFEHTSSPTSQTTYTAANICSYATAGTYTASVTTQRQGVTATNTTSIFVVQPTLTVALIATPNKGTNPLDVNVTAAIGGTASGNIVYKFDCSSDGVFEFTSSPTAQAIYTYSCAYALPDMYTAKVVAERQGLTENNTANITVVQRILNVFLSASPNAGTAPLSGVDLTASVSGNAIGKIIYKFDCTNDGTFEHTSVATSQETYTAVDACSYNTTGTYTANVAVSRQGLTAINTTTITVSSAPQPTLNISLSANPNAGTTPLENVDLTASVSGTATGAIIYKFDCTNDGTFEHTSTATSQTTYAATDVCSYTTAETYTASVTATRAGIIARGTTAITVVQRALTVSLGAKPSTGNNPLKDVSLTAVVSGNATGTIIYKFDCTNDGTFEHTSVATSERAYTAINLCSYDAAGTYTASVTAERQGLAGQGTTNIVAIQRTLAVSASANPGSGIAPLSGVDLTASVSGNATGNIVYKFDCTNDGTFEHTSDATAQTSYTATDVCSYPDVGSFTAKIIAERQGISAIDTVTIAVNPLETPLAVSLNVTPNAGAAPLTGVGFEATLSGTATGNITYKFDCTNDGTFERTVEQILTNPYTAGSLCNYPEPGTYTARVEVDRLLVNVTPTPENPNPTATVVTQSATADITVSPPPLVITTSARLVATAVVNQLYTTVISATGGLGAKTFSATNGTMPTGLSLNADGTISGTPVADGTFHFVVAVVDSQPTITQKIFTLFIAPAPVAEVPQTTIVVTSSVDPSASGGAKLINANNTEIAVSVDSGTVSDVDDTYSIVISSLNTISEAFVPVPSATGNSVADLIYEVDLINNTTAQKVTGFNKPVTVKVSYLDSDIPSGADETKIKVHFYNEATVEWEVLATTVDTANNVVTATVPHLSKFSLVAAAAAPIIEIPIIAIPRRGAVVEEESAYVPIPQSKAGCPLVDFNGDKKINLIDFSILVYWHNKSNIPKRIDINNSGKIDLAKFSMMIFCWTR